MSLPDVGFIKQSAGLGTPLPGLDYISAALFYSATYPSGFSALVPTKQINSLAEAVTAGIAKGSTNYGIMYYHISEFFRMQPKGQLFVGIFPVPTVVSNTPTFAEITTIQNFAQGKVRQIGVYYTNIPFNVVQLDALEAQYTSLSAAHRPLHIVYTPDISGVVDLTTLPDISTEQDAHVSVTIAQDGGAAGLALFGTTVLNGTTSNSSVTVTGISATAGLSVGQNVVGTGIPVGATIATIASGTSITLSIAATASGTVALTFTNKTIGVVGATLGAVALAKVSENIGWVQKFNMSNVELDTLAFGNGELYSAVSAGLLATLDTEHYIFLRKFTDFVGSYFNNSWTAIAQTSDYAKIERNRTMDKAIRVIYVTTLPYINGPLPTNADGTLQDFVIAYIKAVNETQLQQMVINGELSGTQDAPGYKVIIDPTQNVATSGELVVSVELVGIQNAGNIVFNIGFVPSIS